jgi:hypothetical protein
MQIESVLRILDRLGAPYALIGGHAVAARGYPRATIDVDLLTTDVRVLQPSTWDDLGVEGAEIECREGDTDDPLAGVARIVLPGQILVDVIVGRWKWEAAVISRAELVSLGDTRLPVPITSDLILLKLAAGGMLDIRDAAALLAAGDRDALVAEVESRLAEVQPDVTSAWREVLAIEL